MHLIALAWTYVVLMMALAEALGPGGSVLGALFTLLLYGALPLAIVLYVGGTRARRRAQRGEPAQAGAAPESHGRDPGRGGEAAGASVAPVGEEP